MLHVQTLVFATDDSPAAEAARPAAEALARRHGAALHVLRVDLVPTGMPVALEPPPPDRTADGRIEARRRASNVADAIVDYAREVTADVVVIGTHGRTGWRRSVLGSVAEGVLRRAPCAVLTVAPDADLGAEGPVLAPLAFESVSDTVLETAAALADARGTRLVALHAVEPVEIPVPYAMTLAPYDPAWLDESVRETMAQWVAGVADVPVSVEICHGRAERVILEVAAEQRASLIVVGTLGRRGLSRWLLGSVAEAVVREAGCPVLTLRVGARPLLRAGDRSELLPVERDAWPALFDALSAHAAAAPHTVTVDVVSPGAEGRVLDGVPLVGVTYDPHDDAVEVLTASGGHHALRPFAVRTAAGPWAVEAVSDAEAPGPWVLEVVRADGTRERIEVRAAVAEPA